MFKILTFIAILLITQPTFAAKPITTQKATLSNGLRIVVLENHRAPVVTHMLWIYAGSADEKRGKSGVAHYLEHMFFQGADGQSKGDYAKKIQAMGGNFNAFTGRDYTGFYVTAAKQHLAEIMSLESTRIQTLKPEAKTYPKEREIILEERNMRVENSPSAKLSEAMQAALFRNHPYHIPIIGWKHEMEKLDEAAVLDYYKTNYTPSNAVLLLAGDITLDEATKLANKHYGKWQKRPAPTRNWTQEPPLEVAQHITLRDEKVKQPSWYRKYQVPSLKHGDTTQAFPLIVLAELLGGSKASILHQAMVVEGKQAISASASYDAFSLGSGTFSFSATPTAEYNLTQTEKHVDDVIINVATKGVSDTALRRAKNLLKAEAIYARDGISGVAFIFGQLLMMGFDESFFNEWEGKIEAVTREDIIKAASNLTRTSSVNGRLLPINDAPKGESK